MRPRLRFLVFFLLCLLLIAPTVDSKRWETGFLDRTVVVQGAIYKYQVYVPENWTPTQKWPVILFLHGAGERSDDGLIQTQRGIGYAIREHRDWFPAIVVLPQCPKDRWWVEPAMEDAAVSALDATSKEFSGDNDRTYVTGLSMGGYETWRLAEKYPGRFAAIVPICGGILLPQVLQSHPPDDAAPYAEAAKRIGSRTPTWIFHGTNDRIVPVNESRQMHAALKALGGDVRYTEYPGVGHDSWNKAYDEEELFKWMLSKSLSGNAATYSATK